MSLTVREHVAQDIHRAIAGIVRYAAPDLSELKSFEDFHAQPNSLGYRLGFLALDWLVGRSSEASTIGFFRALAGGQRWQEAFESAFGIAVDDFYEAFEAYRSEVAPPLPHLTDDVDEPVLVLLGDVPTETQEEVRAAFANVQAFFSERFEAGTADYTLYVAGDSESLAAAYRRSYGNEPSPAFCNGATAGVVAIITLSCLESDPHYLDRYHFDSIRERLAPWASLPQPSDGLDRRGPQWLLLATRDYAEHAYRVEAGTETFDEIRNRQLWFIQRAPESLSSLGTWDDVYTVGHSAARALSFLAGEWLAEHAGEPTLFESYRQLPSSANWQEAFEASFGITADAFYEDFEAHRAEVAPPLPHLVDDSDEPVLVLLGEMPPETEAAVRTTFAGIHELFGERLAAGSADYTAYVGADAESLADVHRQTTGNEVPEGFCSTAGTGIYVIATVDCVESSPRVLQRHHSHSIRARFAPLESLPPVEQGHDRRGPLWLLLAIEAYADHAHETAAGPQTLDEIRADQIFLARRLVEPLNALATWDEVHAAGLRNARALSSIAGELLADRASEAALFDYFRQLPTSDTWQEAFEAAFGMSVDDFHTEFEAHRAEVAPPFVLHHVRGFVVDPDGNPSAGAWVAANRGEGCWEDAASTGADGAFDLVLRDGSYYLNVDLTTTGCQVPTDDRLHPGGEIEVDGADVTAVEIRLPEGSSCGGS